MTSSFFALFLTLFFVSHGWLGAAAKPVVILDPGHGGKDKGCTWGGVSEKTVTLSIARRVEERLRERGFKTVMTRRKDVTRSLNERAAMANEYQRGIFVSIHCNASLCKSARGIETHYRGTQGRKLAAAIHHHLDNNTHTPNRGLKSSGFCVLRKTNGPAALVECGFLSCPGERRLLTSPRYQQRVARAIAAGIIRTARR